MGQELFFLIGFVFETRRDGGMLQRREVNYVMEKGDKCRGDGSQELGGKGIKGARGGVRRG